MIFLKPWDKVALMAGAATAVCVTLLLVTCFLCDGCLIYQLIYKKKKEKQISKMYGPVYGTSYTKSDSGSPGENGDAGGKDKTDLCLLSRLSSVQSDISRQDSTYSSMSSGRTSPSSVRSLDKPNSTTTIDSPVHQTKISPPAITFSLLASYATESVKLAITVESVNDLPSRDYGAHCDPWVSVTVLKDRRSLRRRPPTPLAYFRTKTIRHAHNPLYSQTFVSDILPGDMKDVTVRLTVMDQDRHSGPQELGTTNINMKEAKQLGTIEPYKFTATQMLINNKKNVGELLFGLSYLPTAQRLSFNVVKVTNIKVENTEDAINPYVRILMFNQSGRLTKKKKTTVKINTNYPVFNETLNFEVPPSQLENFKFLVTVCNRHKSMEMVMMEGNQDCSDQKINGSDKFIIYNEQGRRPTYGKEKDDCIGRIALGKHVRGDRERDHYKSVVETPRKAFSVLHTLK